jgi:hypothetical protein
MSAPAPSMYSPAAARMAQQLGLRMGRPNLEVFAETLLELARADRQVLAVTSDSRGSGKLAPYGQALPEQIVEVGIAEQNLVGIAAGLAAAGKNVFAVSPACFLTARSVPHTTRCMISRRCAPSTISRSSCRLTMPKPAGPYSTQRRPIIRSISDSAKRRFTICTIQIIATNPARPSSCARGRIWHSLPLARRSFMRCWRLPSLQSAMECHAAGPWRAWRSLCG